MVEIQPSPGGARPARRVSRIAIVIALLSTPTAIIAATPPKDATAALADAVSWKKVDVVRDLLDHGADPNGKFPYNNTPLTAAVSTGNTAIVELLIAHGADVNATNGNNDTPLVCAASRDASEIVKLLLAHGAKVDAAGSQGNTPLNALALYGDVKRCESAELLIAAGANVNAAAYRTPLIDAARRNWVALARILLDHGADVNWRTRFGDTAISSAVEEHAGLEMLALLADHGANLNLGQPLTKAARAGDLPTMELLLAKGADIDAADGDGWTALMRVCDTADSPKQVDAVKLLLAHGAALGATANSGWSLFDAARANTGRLRDELLTVLRQAEVVFSAQQAAGAALPAGAQEPFGRGLRAAKQQSWSVAIRSFEAAAKAAPDYRTPLYNLGLAEAQVSGRELRAICWLEASLALAPNAPNAAAVHEQIGDLEVRAEANRDKILALLKATAGKMNSTFPDYWNVAAGAYASAGDLDGALAIVESIPRLTPDVRARELSDLVQPLFYWRDYDMKSEMNDLLYARRLADARTVIGALGLMNDSARDSAHYWLALNAIDRGDFATGRSEMSEVRNGATLVIRRLIEGLSAAGRKGEAASLLLAYDEAFRKVPLKDRSSAAHSAIQIHLICGDIAGAQGFVADTVDAPGFKYHQDSVRLIENARRQNGTAAPAPASPPPVPRRSWGPVENAGGWTHFAKANLSSPLFTDFQAAMQQAAPTASAQSTNDAWQLFIKLRDQANEISSAIEAIRAIRAAQSKTPSQQAGSR